MFLFVFEMVFYFLLPYLLSCVRCLCSSSCFVGVCVCVRVFVSGVCV